MPYDPFGPAPPPRKTKKRAVFAPYQYSPGILGHPAYPTEPGDLGYTPPVPKGPDYRTILENDPLYKLRAGQLTGESISDKAGLDGAINAALVQYGQVPASLLDPKSGWTIDPNTYGLASQNTTAGLSTIARLQAAHAQRNQLNSDTLGARGMSATGALGSELALEQQQYTIAGSDAVQSLNQYASGLQAGWAQHERERRDQLALALQEAAARQAADPANQAPVPKPPSGPSSITLPAGGNGPSATSGSLLPPFARDSRPVNPPKKKRKGLTYGPSGGLAAAQGRAYGGV